MTARIPKIPSKIDGIDLHPGLGRIIRFTGDPPSAEDVEEYEANKERWRLLALALRQAHQDDADLESKK